MFTKTLWELKYINLGNEDRKLCEDEAVKEISKRDRPFPGLNIFDEFHVFILHPKNWKWSEKIEALMQQRIRGYFLNDSSYKNNPWKFLFPLQPGRGGGGRGWGQGWRWAGGGGRNFLTITSSVCFINSSNVPISSAFWGNMNFIPGKWNPTHCS